jgi:hypothetical protein
MLKIYTLFSFLSVLQSSRIVLDTRTFIKCSHCKYFVPDTEEDYRLSTNNKCAMFGKKNIITGYFMPNNVAENRLNETKCGFNAIHFEKNVYAPYTLFYHKLKYKVKSFLQKFRTTQEEIILFVFLIPYLFIALYIGSLILQLITM